MQALPYSRNGRVSPSVGQVEVLRARGQQGGHAGGAAQPHGVQQRTAAAQLGPEGQGTHRYTPQYIIMMLYYILLRGGWQ